MTDSISNAKANQIYQELSRAINNDQIERVRTILQNHPLTQVQNLIEYRDPVTHRTVLHQLQSAEMTRLLLDEFHAHPLIHDKYGRTPLHLAVEKQRLEVTRVLLEHTPELLVETDEAGNIPLHDAIELELVKFLIDSGSPINHQNQVGDTAIHIAARSGRLELTRQLLSLGANPSLDNEEGRTPLHFACENGHKAIVELLVSPLVQPPLDINVADHAGWTPLHNACLGGFPEHESHTPIVSLLLTHGANVHASDCTGSRPIHVCTDTSALRLLLTAGAEPDVCDYDQRSPLHLISTDNSVLLLDQPNVVIDRRDCYGRTPLHYCTDPEKARLLCARGANKDARDQDGWTPVDWSIRTERPEVTAFLLSIGAHPSNELPPLDPSLTNSTLPYSSSVSSGSTRISSSRTGVIMTALISLGVIGYISFIYRLLRKSPTSHSSQVVPPAPRLVGIETNPGPVGGDDSDEESEHNSENKSSTSLPGPTASTAPVNPMTSSLSVWTTIPRDRLEAITDYLSLNELIHCFGCTCHYWLKVLQTIKSRECDLKYYKLGQARRFSMKRGGEESLARAWFDLFLQSPYRRHVTCIWMQGSVDSTIMNRMSLQLPHLKRLTGLRISGDLTEFEHSGIAFPPGLEELSLRLAPSARQAYRIPLAMFEHLPESIETLDIQGPRTLNLWVEHFHLFRTRPHLRKLSLGQQAITFQQMLELRAPMDEKTKTSQLSSFSAYFNTQQSVELVGRLQTLQKCELYLSGRMVMDLSCLSELVCLSKLTLDCSGEVSPDAVLTGLKCLHQRSRRLNEFNLSHSALSSAQLAELMPFLKYHQSEITTFSFTDLWTNLKTFYIVLPPNYQPQPSSSDAPLTDEVAKGRPDPVTDLTREGVEPNPGPLADWECPRCHPLILDGGSPLKSQAMDDDTEGTMVLMMTMDEEGDGCDTMSPGLESALECSLCHHKPSAAEAIPPGPAQTLFKDGLLMIYSYLTDREWMNSLKACVLWYHSACTSPSRHIEYTSLRQKRDQPHIAITSKLNYHFTHLASCGQITLEKLVPMVSNLSSLTSIKQIIIGAPTADISSDLVIPWSTHLTEIYFAFNRNNYPNFFKSLCSISSLTRLVLNFSRRLKLFGFIPSETFRPLIHLIYLYVRTERSQDDILQFGEENNTGLYLPPSLTTLVTNLVPMEHLHKLGSTNLRHLSCISDCLGRGDLRRIFQVAPKLKRLEQVDLGGSDLNDIRLFSHLNTIEFTHLRTIDEPLAREIIVAAMNVLTQCPSIRHLVLDGYLTLDYPFVFQLLPSQILELDLESMRNPPFESVWSAVPDRVPRLRHLHISLQEPCTSVHFEAMKNYFTSPVICPQLQYLSMRSPDSGYVWESPPLVESKPETVPSTRLVGIETNPGPVDSSQEESKQESALNSEQQSASSSLSMQSTARHTDRQFSQQAIFISHPPLIFPYLTLSEESRLRRTNQRCYDIKIGAMNSFRRLRYSTPCYQTQQYHFRESERVLTSRLSAHLTTIQSHQPMDRMTLVTMRQSCPRLTDLSCHLRIQQEDENDVWRLPPFHKLELYYMYSSVRAPLDTNGLYMQNQMGGLVHDCSNSLLELTITIGSDVEPHFEPLFHSLPQLVNLVRFRLASPISEELTTQSIEWLDSAEPLNHSTLTRLLLDLQPSTIEAAVFNYFTHSRLPALTSLQGALCEPFDFGCLSAFPTVTSLTLARHSSPPFRRPELKQILTSSLKSLRTIEFTNVLMADCIPVLVEANLAPQMHDLCGRISVIDSVDSLLNQFDQLRIIKLEHSRSFRSNYHFLTAMPVLEEFHFLFEGHDQIPPGPLDSMLQALSANPTSHIHTIRLQVPMDDKQIARLVSTHPALTRLSIDFEGVSFDWIDSLPNPAGLKFLEIELNNPIGTSDSWNKLSLLKGLSDFHLSFVSAEPAELFVPTPTLFHLFEPSRPDSWLPHLRSWSTWNVTPVSITTGEPETNEQLRLSHYAHPKRTYEEIRCTCEAHRREAERKAQQAAELHSSPPEGIQPPSETPPAKPLVGIEPNPDPVGSSTTGAAATLATFLSRHLGSAAQPPSSQTIFNNGLHLIYSYLTRDEFVSAMRTCHHWSVCASSAPSLHLAFPIKSNVGDIPSPPSHRLRHHFTEIVYPYHPTAAEFLSRTPQVCMAVVNLVSIGRILPSLLSIECDVCDYSFGGSQFNTAVGCWPMRLTSLNLNVSLCRFGFPWLIRSIIVGCPNLTNWHMAELRPVVDELAAFSNPDQLENLTTLAMGVTDISYFPTADWDILKQMRLTQLPPKLNCLEIWGLGGARRTFLIGSLPRSPSALEKLDLYRHEVVQNDLGHLTISAPKLTSLSLGQCYLPDLLQLGQFQALQSLQISIDRSTLAQYSPSQSDTYLMNGLIHCQQLTSLEFGSWCPRSFDSWTQLAAAQSACVTKLLNLQFSQTYPPSLDVVRPFESLITLRFGWLSLFQLTKVKEYFRSPFILPHLQTLETFSLDRWAWRKDLENHTDYRIEPSSLHPSFSQDRVYQQQLVAATSLTLLTSPMANAVPASRLIGIELNPGPFDPSNITGSIATITDLTTSDPFHHTPTLCDYLSNLPTDLLLVLVRDLMVDIDVSRLGRCSRTLFDRIRSRYLMKSLVTWHYWFKDERCGLINFLRHVHTEYLSRQQSEAVIDSTNTKEANSSAASKPPIKYVGPVLQFEWTQKHTNQFMIAATQVVFIRERLEYDAMWHSSTPIPLIPESAFVPIHEPSTCAIGRITRLKIGAHRYDNWDEVLPNLACVPSTVVELQFMSNVIYGRHFHSLEKFQPWPTKLHTLQIQGFFNYIFESDQLPFWPSTLTSLTLYAPTDPDSWMCREQVVFHLPLTLLYLHLGPYIFKSQDQGKDLYQRLVFPSTLTHLSYQSLDRPPSELHLPDSLTTLELGAKLEKHDWNKYTNFDESVDGFKLPLNLTRLFFGDGWKSHSLDGLIWNDSLTILDLGDSFNHDLSRVTFPVSLIQLRLGDSFNQPLDQVTFPSHLESLQFGQNFNQPLSQTHLPDSLTELDLCSWDFNHSLLDVKLPPSLTELSLLPSYPHFEELVHIKFPLAFEGLWAQDRWFWWHQDFIEHDDYYTLKLSETADNSSLGTQLTTASAATETEAEVDLNPETTVPTSQC